MRSYNSLMASLVRDDTEVKDWVSSGEFAAVLGYVALAYAMADGRMHFGGAACSVASPSWGLKFSKSCVAYDA